MYHPEQIVLQTSDTDTFMEYALLYQLKLTYLDIYDEENWSSRVVVYLMMSYEPMTRPRLEDRNIASVSAIYRQGDVPDVQVSS
ncbi:hypothetical protein THARTR1_10611 [Trichoderma harzianum]|uniref:Uncharacterized protein n=1 Tax=Trichoderma harzianum TaxID=5544 RepID=A0A2K0TNK6_TRIHA|nr:hypothetical protein THARTR1_10611 [Trichoderma harzianum]